jgi:hypothetical protein
VVNQLFLSTADDEGLPGGSDAQKTLRAIVSKLQDEQLVKLFTFLCDWNTTSGESTNIVQHQQFPNFVSAANSTAAQEVLLAIFSCKAPDDLSKTKGMKRISETLLLYSQRHYDRISRLLQVHFSVHL